MSQNEIKSKSRWKIHLDRVTFSLVFVFFFLSYEKIGVSVFGVCVGQSKVESRRKILCFKISCDIK